MCDDIVFHLTQFKVHYRIEPKKKQHKKINRRQINNISFYRRNGAFQQQKQPTKSWPLRIEHAVSTQHVTICPLVNSEKYYNGHVWVCLPRFFVLFHSGFRSLPHSSSHFFWIFFFNSDFFFIHIGTEDRVLNWEIIIIKHQWLLRGQLYEARRKTIIGW